MAVLPISMQAHRPGASAAVFWLNGAESWVDITKSTSRRKTSASTHWISESGILDLFVFMAPDPKDILKEYTALVGRTAMPQYFAIGHHQCRWNYLNEEDVLSVAQRFDEEDMPLDVIWLDMYVAYSVCLKHPITEPSSAVNMPRTTRCIRRSL